MGNNTETGIVYCPFHQDKRMKPLLLNQYYCFECKMPVDKNKVDILERLVSSSRKSFSYDGKRKRNMVLVSKNTVYIRKRKKAYFRIICIDLLTRETVNIVDTNGACEGMHSFSEPFISMGILSCFTADFVCVNDCDTLFSLRIVSSPMVVGKTNMGGLYTKFKCTMNLLKTKSGYYGVYPAAKPEKQAFYLNKDVRIASHFCSGNHYKYSFFLINLTGSQVMRYKGNNKLQVRVGEVFINLDEKYSSWECMEIRGLAVLKITKNDSGHKYFSIENGFMKPWFMNKKLWKRELEIWEREKAEDHAESCEDVWQEELWNHAKAEELPYFYGGGDADDPYDPYADDPYADDPYAYDPYAYDPYAYDPYCFYDCAGAYDYDKKVHKDKKDEEKEDEEKEDEKEAYLYNHMRFDDPLFAVDFNRKKISLDCIDELKGIIGYLDDLFKKSSFMLKTETSETTTRDSITSAKNSYMLKTGTSELIFAVDGKRVIHNRYGSGVIIQCDINGYITVKHDEGCEKKYPFPGVFLNRFLSFEDTSLLELYSLDMNNKGMKIEFNVLNHISSATYVEIYAMIKKYYSRYERIIDTVNDYQAEDAINLLMSLSEYVRANEPDMSRYTDFLSELTKSSLLEAYYDDVSKKKNPVYSQLLSVYKGCGIEAESFIDIIR